MWHSGENEEWSNSFFGNLPISSPKCPSEDPLTFHQCTYQSCCWALSQELYFEPKAQTGTQTSVPPSFSRSTFSSSGSTSGDFSSPKWAQFPWENWVLVKKQRQGRVPPHPRMVCSSTSHGLHLCSPHVVGQERPQILDTPLLGR